MILYIIVVTILRPFTRVDVLHCCHLSWEFGMSKKLDSQSRAMIGIIVIVVVFFSFSTFQYMSMSAKLSKLEEEKAVLEQQVKELKKK